MAVRNAAKSPPASSMVDVAELSAGEPVTVHQSTTFRKQIGSAERYDEGPSADEINAGPWSVYRISAHGEQWIADVPGKPQESDLYVRFGSGRFLVHALDPRTGEKRPGKPNVMLVDPDGSFTEGEQARRAAQPAPQGWEPPTDSIMYAEQPAPLSAEDRYAAERRTADEEHRRKLEFMEFKRQEKMDKDESDRKAREDKRDDERRDEDRRRQARSDKIFEGLMQVAMAAVPAVIAYVTREPRPAPSIDDRILRLVADQRQAPPPPADAMQQAMTMMQSLDSMLERRIAATQRNEPEEDDGILKAMMPMLMAKMLGGMPGEGPAPGGVNPIQLAGQALRDPAALRSLLAVDRDAIIDSVAKVVEGDPAIAQELMERLNKP